MEEKSALKKETVLALGNFDGLHIGHRAVLEKALELSREMNLKACVLLFDVHPKKLLSGRIPPKLMTDEARDEMLSQMGFEIIRIAFDKICNLSSEEFSRFIVESYNVAAVCCGFNYHYGKAASGNAQTLKADGERFGFRVFAMESVEFENLPVSSSRIREEIEKGNICGANKMLGREFSYKIEVVSGDRRGRLLGYPTINQFFPENFVTARFGVYASKVCLGEKWYSAVTNIGVRPTVQTKSFRSETCILGFSGDLYGLEIEVFLLDFIRDEKKFENLEGLSAAIKSDAEKAQKIFKGYENNE